MKEKEQTMIQIDNVSKVYKLGEIGGTTLRETFQRLFAKILHKEDPTKKIGAKNYNKGEKFLALDNINLNIKKGERIGIIGHNGAGKSTLLKLICRVTAPTTGEIGLNGRITSMLEVGTGFHGELTGRENIYVNGAILGMTKKEIDEVIENIIDFSEVREFIDTPVKRYSSGMYVKLAFSVAAHLKSEIMIMDEVLAVGDMAFQNKCLTKMRSVSEDEGRTILYVSHNMNTIRRLCEKAIVLDKGKIIYYGDVEKAISIYMKEKNLGSLYTSLSFSKKKDCTETLFFKYVEIIGNTNTIAFGDSLKVLVRVGCFDLVEGVVFRITLSTSMNGPVCSFFSKPFIFNKGTHEISFRIDTTHLSPGIYFISLHAATYVMNSFIRHDYVTDVLSFEVDNVLTLYNLKWDARYWGNMVGEEIDIQEVKMIRDEQ